MAEADYPTVFAFFFFYGIRILTYAHGCPRKKDDVFYPLAMAKSVPASEMYGVASSMNTPLKLPSALPLPHLFIPSSFLLCGIWMQRLEV